MTICPTAKFACLRRVLSYANKVEGKCNQFVAYPWLVLMQRSLSQEARLGDSGFTRVAIVRNTVAVCCVPCDGIFDEEHFVVTGCSRCDPESGILTANAKSIPCRSFVLQRKCISSQCKRGRRSGHNLKNHVVYIPTLLLRKATRWL